ncbi:hypothetical protein LUX09_04300 [Streptomyces albogriseolus]|nr:hypothetical protein [Streptomyces albogriseolus]
MQRRTVLLLGAALAVTPAAQAHAHPDHPTHPGGSRPIPGNYGQGWRPLAPIASGPRQEHSVAAVGDDVYVIGGIVHDGAAASPPPDRSTSTTRAATPGRRRRRCPLP